MNRMVGLFSVGTFNKTRVTSKVDLHLKHLQDQYSPQLERTKSYEHPLVIPESEWKALVENENEKALQKQGKTPPGPGRYEALLIM